MSGLGGDGWLENYLPYRLYRVTNRLTARLQDRLQSTGINPSRWRVLSVLRSFGTQSIREIVEHTLMKQTTVSWVIVQLEGEGLVSRRSSQKDSRATDVVLTERGHAAFNEIAPAARRHQDTALGGLTRKEVAALRALLVKIEQNIDLYD